MEQKFGFILIIQVECVSICKTERQTDAHFSASSKKSCISVLCAVVYVRAHCIVKTEGQTSNFALLVVLTHVVCLSHVGVGEMLVLVKCWCW